MEEETKPEMETEQEVPLIDILYKDSYRIDSFIAQLTEGVIRSKKYLENSSKEKSSLVRFNAKLISGDRNTKTSANNSTEANVEEHDYNILKLLEILNLDELSYLPSIANAQLVHLTGRISIRNMKAFAEMLPAFSKTKQIPNAKNFKDIIPLMKFIPLNIEMTLQMNSNEVLNGILKEEYLLSSYENISATYGINLPNTWHVIGILDTNENIDQINKTQLQTALDIYSLSMKQLQPNNGRYNFVPILIFRGLSK